MSQTHTNEIKLSYIVKCERINKKEERSNRFITPRGAMDIMDVAPLLQEKILHSCQSILSTKAGKLTTSQLHPGMSKFEREVIDSKIGWRKLADPGD
uniref:Uncharacterized protein n=1 Tax=Trichogramma kaykai TaxID=54128 RepID=A0ABD2VTS3_9HYME